MDSARDVVRQRISATMQLQHRYWVKPALGFLPSPDRAGWEHDNAWPLGISPADGVNTSSAPNIVRTAPVSTEEHTMDKPMSNTREIIFIDRAVMDIPGLVAGLRPGVAPVLLGGELPAAEVIARAVRDYESLDAIHIVAHGRPGELSFSGGALSVCEH